MAKPAVIVVGADKGGVGKTTVSRTLLDYFSANNVLTRAFDTESPRGTLKRFHPDITEIVDMTTTSDQMKIFDTLNSVAPSVTVIDVRAGLLSPALASLRDIGFLDAAKSGQITFAVFHILGPSIASLDEIAETANFMVGARVFPGEELHQRYPVLPVGSGHLQFVFPPDQGRDRPRHPEAQRNGLRAGRSRLGSIPEIRRQQGHQRRGRELFLRAARLCPALARQCLERIRPHQADRHRRFRQILARAAAKNNCVAHPIGLE